MQFVRSTTLRHSFPATKYWAILRTQLQNSFAYPPLGQDSQPTGDSL